MTPLKTRKPAACLYFLACVLVAMTSSVRSAEAPEPDTGQPLPKLGAKPTEVSVSGISSGAYMAGQFQMAHGERVLGAAIIAGGPYGCAQSAFSAFTFGFGGQLANLSKATSGCMLNLYAIWGVPNPARLVRQTEDLAESGKIAPLDQVRSDRVYLFSGKQDRTVVPAIGAAAYDYYVKLGVAKQNIKRVTRYGAGHAFVTEDSGGSCQISEKPFVVDCDYDQAGDLLAHFYGTLNPRRKSLSGAYLTFDQRPFFNGLSSHGLADTGTVYIPQRCQDEPGCRVHVAFHGCAQNRSQVGDAFVKGSGFAQWADGNRLVILFPQVHATVGNTQACWDWWGYTGPDFLTRDGTQIKAVNRMLDHLAATP